MKKFVLQHNRSGPYRSSTASTMRLSRTSSANQVNSKCDLWRRSPRSGPPLLCSNASSLWRNSRASPSVIAGIGWMHPSRWYCSSCDGVNRLFIAAPSVNRASGSKGEIPDRVRLLEGLGVSLHGDRAGLQNVRAVCAAQCHRRILFGEKYRHAIGGQPHNDTGDLLDEDRRKAQRRFIEQKTPRLRHQAPANREHLLLATGHRSSFLRPALG